MNYYGWKKRRRVEHETHIGILEEMVAESESAEDRSAYASMTDLLIACSGRNKKSRNTAAAGE